MVLLVVLVRNIYFLDSLNWFRYIFTGSDQPVGGYHVLDSSKLSQQQLHPGMNPDPVERGRELGHENAHGGQCVGTGGHARWRWTKGCQFRQIRFNTFSLKKKKTIHMHDFFYVDLSSK
jgi:hypothetical protein